MTEQEAEGRGAELDPIVAGHLITLLASEYEALKAEQTTRISIRDNVIWVNFAVIAAIVAAVLSQDPPRIAILHAIPIAVSSIYWIYLNNDLVVSALQRYFSTEFPQRVASVLSPVEAHERAASLDVVASTLGGWESFHRTQVPHRRPRKVANTVVVLLGSVISSVAALAMTASISLRSLDAMAAIWTVNFALTAATAFALFVTRDI